MDANLLNALTGYLPQVLPEVVLVVMACVLFLGGTYNASRTVWGSVAIGSLVVAGLTLWAVAEYVPTFETRQQQILPNGNPAKSLHAQVVELEEKLTPNTLAGDEKVKAQNELDAARALLTEQFVSPLLFSRVAIFVKVLALLGGLLLLLSSWDDVPSTYAADSFACLLLIIAGTSLTAAANDLVTLFICLELISIPTYVILYLPRADAPAQEAALKYFLLSVFSSGLVLFGFSYLYGLAGSTNLAVVTEVLSGVKDGTAERGMVVLALILVVAGLGFRITAVPFHFYAPDVFQGTTTANAAVLAFIPKVAGFVALFKLLPLLGVQVPTLLWALAAITMTAGNILALLQDNVKRLLAYSSVAHSGYMLIGLAVAPHLTEGVSVTGVQGILFYLVAYGAMNIGAFAVLSYLSTSERPVETTDDLAGLGRTHPGVALLLTVFLFSLIGLPLTAGFLGKFQLFLGALSVPEAQERYYVYLVLIAAVNATIGGWYYLRLVAVMFLRDSLRPIHKAPTWPVLVSIWACALVTLFGGMLPAPISNAAREAGSAVVRPLPPTPSAPAGQAQLDERQVR